jgi:hypothetical protein
MKFDLDDDDGDPAAAANALAGLGPIGMGVAVGLAVARQKMVHEGRRGFVSTEAVDAALEAFCRHTLARLEGRDLHAVN